mmetsp:Transcript_126086/g.218421  ORF Transcript_126086/g.218421 Transcript_126086/m.218421 type:complete len:120 (-) Transcript_126086:76-435(-)
MSLPEHLIIPSGATRPIPHALAIRRYKMKLQSRPSLPPPRCQLKLLPHTCTILAPWGLQGSHFAFVMLCDHWVHFRHDKGPVTVYTCTLVQPTAPLPHALWDPRPPYFGRGESIKRNTF